MDRLVIKPRTPAVAISIAVVAGPPPADGYEAIAEVIVVMDEVIVIMAMPVIAAPIGAMPNSTPAIPARTAMPAAGGKARATHRTTKTTTAPTCEVGTATEVTTHASA